MTGMFGFSLGKLLVLLAVVGAVWYGFKYMSRLQYQRERRAEARDRLDRQERGEPPPPPPTGGRRRRQKAEAPAAQDMVSCPACKAYVPAKGAKNCGRPDCPY